MGNKVKANRKFIGLKSFFFLVSCEMKMKQSKLTKNSVKAKNREVHNVNDTTQSLVCGT